MTAARDETCSGFKNYPTFTLAAWIDNDRNAYDHWRRAAIKARANAGESAPLCDGLNAADRTRLELARRLETYWTNEVDEAVLDDPLGGLLRYGLQSVDWHELAEHMLAADN